MYRDFTANDHDLKGVGGAVSLALEYLRNVAPKGKTRQLVLGNPLPADSTLFLPVDQLQAQRKGASTEMTSDSIDLTNREAGDIALYVDELSPPEAMVLEHGIPATDGEVANDRRTVWGPT